MRRSPVGRLVPLVFALSLRVAAAQQATPPDPVESATVRLGPIGFNPALLIRDVGRETNVFNEATDPKSDFTATISPRLEIVMHPGPMRFSYTTTSDYVYYQTYKSEGGTNVGSAVRAEFDLGPFTPFASAGFANTRDRLNREIDARARHHDESYAAGTHVQLFDKFFVNAGARRSSTAFDSGADFRGQELQTTLNRTDEALDAGGGLALTPLTSLQVTVSRERSRFEFTPERNSESLRVMPSVTFSPLAILSGTASFGYRRFDGASAQVPDYRGFVSIVTLSTTVKERQHIDATFSRDLQYSYEEDVAEYIETGLTVGWNWQVAGPVDLRLSGGRSRLHYRSPNLTGSNTDDTAHNYGFSAGWNLRNHLRAALNGDWRGRTSERSVDRTYDSRRIYATLTWGKV